MKVNEKIDKITESTLLVGIDIGKTKCCVRFCDYRGREVYHKVWFDRTEDLDAIGCQVTAAMHLEKKPDVIVAMEPTGHYWLNVNQYFQKSKIETVLIPTQTVKQSKGVYDQESVKSDPKDAILIARLAAEGKYVEAIERDEIFQSLYTGYHIYEDIQKELNRIANKIHGWNDRYFPELEYVFAITSVGIQAIYEKQLLPCEISEMSLEEFTEIMIKNNSRANKSKIKKVWELSKKSSGIKSDSFTKEELKRLYERYLDLKKEKEEIEKKLKTLASQIDYVEKLVEIDGIGYMSIVGVLAETGDLRNYESYRQILKMAGLSLRESSSGQKKGKKHISKRGRSKLRRNLKQIVISLLANNSFFQQLHTYYTTKRERTLIKLISINAIIRKLLSIMMSMVRTGESFNIEKATRESCILE